MRPFTVLVEGAAVEVGPASKCTPATFQLFASQAVLANISTRCQRIAFAGAFMSNNAGHVNCRAPLQLSGPSSLQSSVYVR